MSAMDMSCEYECERSEKGLRETDESPEEANEARSSPGRETD